MAEQGIQMDQEELCCSICLDLLKDPVTISCGHSYCVSCIKSHWDEEDQKRMYSCPQCRQAFRPRPVLVRNTMLADLVEELKKTGLQAAPADHCCYAEPGDVACDVCTGRKLKATKSCLQCLVSYCEQHLQPHYESAAFDKHKLVEPSKKLQENICSRHNEVMKIFCRSDQQSICYLCSMDEHKGHDTVSAAAERTEKQRELGESRQIIQKRIQDMERDVEVIQQEITDLRRKDAELDQLSHTEDHTQFLQNYTLLTRLGDSTASNNISPSRDTEDVSAAVSEAREKLQDVPGEEWTKMSLGAPQVEVSLPQAEPKTRDEFLKYSCEITLDQNTAHICMRVEGIREAQHYLINQRSIYDHLDRFTDWCQVLCREGQIGQCYWEVELKGEVFVAVAYKSISRVGRESGFGNSDKSWALQCFNGGYEFRHDNIRTSISGPQSSRVGVYLDHRAGILSFYSVSETMTLLHRVHTTFTQPLCPGLGMHVDESYAHICNALTTEDDYFRYVY